MRITLYKFALKNLERKWFRSVAVALSVAMVAGTLFSVSTVMKSVDSSIKRGTARLGADLIVVPRKFDQKAKEAFSSGGTASFYMDYKLMGEVKATKTWDKEAKKTVAGVEHLTPVLFLEDSSHVWPDGSKLRIIGFDPETDFTIIPWMEDTLSRKLTDGEVLLGSEVTFGDGNFMELLGADFKVVSALVPMGMPFWDRSVFIPLPAAWELVRRERIKNGIQTPDNWKIISAILVRTVEGAIPHQVRSYLRNDFKGLSAIATEDMIVSVRRQLVGMLKSVVLICVIVWVIALLMIGVISSMIINERQREFGLLRAMGANRMTIFKLVMQESSTLAGIGGIGGIVFGGLFLAVFQNMIKASLSVPSLLPAPAIIFIIIIGCFILAFLTGLGASLFPALRISLMEPFRAITSGE